MRNRTIYIVVFGLMILGILSCNAYPSIRTFTSRPSAWKGHSLARSNAPVYDPGKKTVFIIADNALTELFDMLAPFYLFNETDQANVYIVARDSTPIYIKKDLYIWPQLTFREADAMMLAADVIVVPALSKRDEHQDPDIIAWIKKYTTDQTRLITICDGASTGAATGLYDGKPITCHASDFEKVHAPFTRPLWVQHTSVTRSGNLYSTAGVSNAVEGSLLVIRDIFGPGASKKVAARIHYPHDSIQLAHQSIALSSRNKLAAVNKVFFNSNSKIGAFIGNGISEFTLVAFLDTYSRTFPASFKTLLENNSSIRTKYGLTLLSTGDNRTTGLDEIHILSPEAFSRTGRSFPKNTIMIPYEESDRMYLFDRLLNNIAAEFGQPFSEFVKISLDYN